MGGNCRRTAVRMTIAYFDCFNGAGGDMLAAALIDAGADAERLRRQLESLPISGFRLAIEKTKKQWLSATRFLVELDTAVHRPHRHLKHVLDILARSSLSESARQKAARVFGRLAAAEARVHGTIIERIHFHEVGGEDAILDIVGTILALEMLDVQRVLCSPLPLGSGSVRCAHGTIPIPAPATIELLKGVPVAATEETGELTTPTAAALLATLADGFGPLPAMTLRSIGYGAGSRETAHRPNVVRVFVGTPADDATGDTDEVCVLETNLDDASPEIVGHCMARLLEKGALDVYAVPIHMKKSRTGVVLTVLCEPARVAEMEQVLFAETTTFGIRRHNAMRAKLRRRFETVTTRFGDIRMKIGEGEGAVTASPEFEDCKAAAQRHGAALREVLAAAQLAWAGKRAS